MHSAQRSTEPEFFDELRAANAQWDNLAGTDRQRISNRLTLDFGEVCVYCEQPCHLPTRAQSPNDESIDHFRPIHRFPSLWLDWLNLVYACRMCNQNKGYKWPGSGDTYDEVSNGLLSHDDSRYIPVTGYVNPSEIQGQRPAQEFFDFDVITGKIAPSDRLAHEEWSVAYRTIWDMELNSNSLCNLRLERLDWLIERLDTVNDFDEKLNVMLRLMLPKMPFSRFINAYVTSRFPLLDRLL